MMLVTSLIWLVRRHRISVLASKRVIRQGCNDPCRFDHGRVLGPADVGYMVGMGSAIDVVSDPVPVLSWLSRYGQGSMIRIPPLI